MHVFTKEYDCIIYISIILHSFLQKNQRHTFNTIDCRGNAYN